MPHLKVLEAIATNTKEPTPLRVRASELALAIRAGDWSIASSRATQRAVRRLTAQASIDEQLLANAPVAPEEAPARKAESPDNADSVLAQADLQRKRLRKIEALKDIAADESLTAELRTAAKEQLQVLGIQSIEPTEQPAEPNVEEDSAAAEIRALYEAISRGGDSISTGDPKPPRGDELGTSCPDCRYRQPANRTACVICNARLPEHHGAASGASL